MVYGGLRWFACFPLFSLPIVPNSGGDLWWFAVICGRLWWFAVVCGGLGWFAMVCGGLSYSHTVTNGKLAETAVSIGLRCVVQLNELNNISR